MWESFRNVYRRKRCTHVTFSSLKLLISMCVTVHLPTHFDSLILIRLLFFFFFLTSTESSTSFMVMYGIKFLTSFLLYPGALVQLHYLSFFVCLFSHMPVHYLHYHRCRLLSVHLFVYFPFWLHSILVIYTANPSSPRPLVYPVQLTVFKNFEIAGRFVIVNYRFA